MLYCTEMFSTYLDDFLFNRLFVNFHHWNCRNCSHTLLCWLVYFWYKTFWTWLVFPWMENLNQWGIHQSFILNILESPVGSGWLNYWCQYDWLDCCDVSSSNDVFTFPTACHPAHGCCSRNRPNERHKLQQSNDERLFRRCVLVVWL